MNPILIVRNFFQSYFYSSWKQAKGKEEMVLILFLSISSIINYLLCETIYFIPLYSADQLYTPLFVKDWMRGEGILHWYLPPSPYFFPDIGCMAILYWVFPFLYLPTIYGVVQMVFLQLGLYMVLSSKVSKEKTIQFLIWFQTLFTVFSLLGASLGDKPLPLVHFLSNAHHSTGFFFSLFLVSLYYQFQSNENPTSSITKQPEYDHKTKINLSFIFSKMFLPKQVSKFLFLFGFSLLYISDRFSFCIGIFCLVIIKSSEMDSKDWKMLIQKKSIFSFLFIPFYFIIMELILYSLKTKLQIPNSFGILLGSLQTKTFGEITFLTIHYVYDFSKLLVYENRSLLGLLFVFVFFFRRFPHQLKRMILLLIPILLFLLVVVGRFTYLHPYPIRYLFPLLFLGLLGVSWGLAKKRNPIPLPILPVSLLLWILIFSFFPNPRKEVQTFYQSITRQEVSYDLEKPIRFWTEGKRNPTPVQDDGKPYRWITGAFHTP
ncbi:hypothetical protein EHR02_14940 [Leptospira levettii]|uniref:hypothetical protein n=1 Tax=Leptospira levettii TaxID=2023178 RepID=UPI001083B791|nr:hypothetical protein [Leptospira levettii]TGM93982.1 hypothetical protein EHR02_14940 [Leptospira levettii]